MKRVSYLVIGVLIGVLIGTIIFIALFSSEGGSVSVGDNVGVVYIEGQIVAGRGGDNYIGSEDIVDQINKALEDRSVKAIVLRIDSPGGSPAGAQEVVEKIKDAKHKKPVVVSMADMATSAAYYMALPANYIYALPDTTTGSIGVIMVHKDESNLIENSGLRYTVVKSGKYKDMTASWNKLDGWEEKEMAKIVDDSFNRFISDISIYREIPIEDVKKMSDGRVYRGEEAKELGLIDEVGTLEDAIHKAAELANIEKPSVKYINKTKTTDNKNTSSSLNLEYLSNRLLWIL